MGRYLNDPPLGAPDHVHTYVCSVLWPGPWSSDRYELIGLLMSDVSDFCRRQVRQFTSSAAFLNDDILQTGFFSKGRTSVQRLFTIEIRVDFRDEDKLPLMQKAIQQAARHVYAQSALIGDAVKPQVVIYSHDYIKGHADIPLFDDDILKGENAITEAGNSSLGAGEAKSTTGAVTMPAQPPVAEDPDFSPELLGALK